MKWKKIIAAVAPSLATALGGPLAGMATKQIAGALLGDENAKEAEIEAAIVNGGPDTLIKLRELDQSFAIKMREMDIDLEKIDAEDRANARARQIATHDHTPTVLAAIMIGGFAAVQVWLLGHEIPAQNKEIMVRALGILDAATMLILGYYFGSSRGSRAKDELLRGKQ